MIDEVSKLHISALPHTFSSRLGLRFVKSLYSFVNTIGYIKTINQDNQIVGVISGIGKWILTLVVLPEYQRKGIGRQLINMINGNSWVYTEKCSMGFYLKMGYEEMFRLGKIIVLCRK